MVYEFIVKLLGAGIAAVVCFQPLTPEYTASVLTLSARLEAPITDEARALVGHGFVFGIQYYSSVIINDRKAFSARHVNRLARGEVWTVNGEESAEEDIQAKMGTARFSLSEVPLREGDELLLFVKATILPDEDFRRSTGMKTRVLWNHYVPRIKETWKYEHGRLVRR